MSRISRSVSGALAALTLAASLTTGGCRAAAPISRPSGVDGLVIPTSSPDPGEFVAEIDNAWLPLSRIRDSLFLAGSQPPLSVRPETEPGPVLDGVATTEVDTVTADREETLLHTDYFAQDRDGNVWWFGRAGQWRAGEEGAEAGLVMPADPRVGDGYRPAAVPGAPRAREVVVTVEEVGATVEVSGAEYDDVVVLAVTTPARPGLVQRASFARGVGLVEVETLGGEPARGGLIVASSLKLERFTPLDDVTRPDP